MKCHICRRRCKNRSHQKYTKYLIYTQNGIEVSERGIERYGKEFFDKIIMIEQHPLKRKLENIEEKINFIHKRLRPMIRRLEDLEVEKAYYENQIYETELIEQHELKNNTYSDEELLSEVKIPTDSTGIDTVRSSS